MELLIVAVLMSLQVYGLQNWLLAFYSFEMRICVQVSGVSMFVWSIFLSFYLFSHFPPRVSCTYTMSSKVQR